ncbi:unnamed protein product [Bathycoccus prasinos]
MSNSGLRKSPKTGSKNNLRKNVSSNEIIKSGNHRAEVLEAYKDITSAELKERAGIIHTQLGNKCVNVLKAGRTQKDANFDDAENVAITVYISDGLLINPGEEKNAPVDVHTHCQYFGIACKHANVVWKKYQEQLEESIGKEVMFPRREVHRGCNSSKNEPNQTTVESRNTCNFTTTFGSLGKTNAAEHCKMSAELSLTASKITVHTFNERFQYVVYQCDFTTKWA